MFYAALVKGAERLSANSLSELPSMAEWETVLSEKREQWRDMLGLNPWPVEGPPVAEIVGKLELDDVTVEKIVFQPVPNVRVAVNLYLPKVIKGKIPAVVYACGHARPCKIHYQEHPRWFAANGYAAWIADTIELGEGDGDHHGTYTRGWWRWTSQGYSPAAFEVWSATRAADYLQTRPEVDPERLGITGNSGGGTMSWFVGALDPRFKVVAPSCQTGSIYQHIRDKSLDGHCDCSFWLNSLRWDLPDVASLIAPRPLLIAAATEDLLFHPYAFRELYQKARHLYRLYEREDALSLVEAVTPHGYSSTTRLAIFNWFEKHLKGVKKPAAKDVCPDRIPDEALKVFPTGKPPASDAGKTVDRFFISLPEPPKVTDEDDWRRRQADALSRLRQGTFRHIPDRAPAPDYEARNSGCSGGDAPRKVMSYEFESEPGVPVRVVACYPRDGVRPRNLLVGAMSPTERSSFLGQGAGLNGVDYGKISTATVEVRGTGSTSIGPGLEWHVRRAYPLLGHTLPERQTFDLSRAVQVLRAVADVGKIALYGEGQAAATALYAALLDAGVDEIVLKDPVASHWDGPEFMNVLRVGDLPHNLALAYPRPIAFIGAIPKAFAWTVELYEKLGRKDAVRRFETLKQWAPFGA